MPTTAVTPALVQCKNSAARIMARALPTKNMALYMTTTFTSLDWPSIMVLMNTLGRRLNTMKLVCTSKKR